MFDNNTLLLLMPLAFVAALLAVLLPYHYWDIKRDEQRDNAQK